MKNIEEAANGYAGIRDDKYHNRAIMYSPNDIYDAFENGAKYALRYMAHNTCPHNNIGVHIYDKYCECMDCGLLFLK